MIWLVEYDDGLDMKGVCGAFRSEKSALAVAEALNEDDYGMVHRVTSIVLEE